MATSRAKNPTWPNRAACASLDQLATVDIQHITNSIDDVSTKLFKQDGTAQLLVCHWGNAEKLKAEPVFSFDELDAFLERNLPQQQTPESLTTYLFFIDQEHTKARLDVSREALNLLFSHISIFPQCGYLLLEFAPSNIPLCASRYAFHATRSADATVGLRTELCMLLKYIEPNGNKFDPVPWSVRQQLFYQSIDPKLKRECLILMRASSAFRRRIQQDFQTNGGCAFHWTNLPFLLVSSLTPNWASYCKFLDEKVWEVDKSSNFTNPFSQTLGEVNFKTLQATQRYHDLLTRAMHVLESNSRILQSLLQESVKRKDLEPNTGKTVYTNFEALIEEVETEFTGYISNLFSTRERLDRVTEAIRDSITLRGSYHAALESNNMRQLTLQSVREARTVKAIALVTLIYLPATFVATFLGINGISITHSQSGRLQVDATPQVGVYFALTTPLTIGTLLAWWMWEWWNKSRKNDLEERRVEGLKIVGSLPV